MFTICILIAQVPLLLKFLLINKNLAQCPLKLYSNSHSSLNFLNIIFNILVTHYHLLTIPSLPYWNFSSWSKFWSSLIIYCLLYPISLGGVFFWWPPFVLVLQDIMISGAPKIAKTKSTVKMSNQTHIATRFRYSLRVSYFVLKFNLNQ